MSLPDFNFRDEPDEAPEPKPKLPLKKTPIRRPDRSVVEAAARAGEQEGFRTRETTNADPSAKEESKAPKRTSPNSDHTDQADRAERDEQRRRRGRPKGPPAKTVTFSLFAEDVDRFKDLCDLEWDGATYKDGFRRLLNAYDAGKRR